MKNDNLKIEWIQKSGKQCLKFTFAERLTEKDAAGAIMEWREAFRSKMDQSIVLIWDCKIMKGYDGEARVKWIDALKEMKSQIDSIWLISESSTIRMGAAFIGAFTSMDINVVESESEIKFKDET